MHQLSTHFILGFHGCDKATGEQILAGADFKTQRNDYDWLGHGIYFWENNPERGLQFAQEKQKRLPEKIKTPFVIGAILDLKLCLDMTTQKAIEEVEKAYLLAEIAAKINSQILPENRYGEDNLLRERDCLVIETLHNARARHNLPYIDSVKGIFTEGGQLYANSGFFRKTHVQICIRNTACIVGTFRVRQPQ
jgi:hypothetical protein